MNGAELLVAALYKKGVRQVFSLNGGHISLVYKALIDYGIRIVDVRHEEAAAHMAYAWARLTGQPAVVLATAGPGVTNTTTGVATAFQAATPMVVIGAHAPIPQMGMGAMQEIDQAGIMKPITKFAELIFETKKIPMWVNRAFQTTSSGKPGPVFLDIPTSVFKAEADPKWLEQVSDTLVVDPPAPDLSAVQKVTSILRNAERPLIIAGGGTFFSGAHEALIDFAERHGVPVLTTSLNKGVFPDTHPLHVGAARSLAMATADVVIILGARLNFILGYGYEPRFSKDSIFVQVDTDPTEIARTRPIDVPVISDVRKFLLELDMALQDHPNVSKQFTSWVQKLQKKDRDNRDRLDRQAAELTSSPIHPLRLCYEVNKYLTKDTTLVADGGDILSYGRLAFGRDLPGHYVDPGALGTIGIGISAAIAAKIARPESPVILVVGDGSLGFTLSELDTAVRHQIPIVIVVSNNGGWNIERKAMELDFGPEYTVGTTLNRTRYDLIMEAFGGHGEWVTELSQLPDALQRSIEAGVPALVNVETDANVVSPDLARGLAQVPEDQPINYKSVTE
ncbi:MULTISPECIES: thiamine pyrophosphate-binding protein [Neobacillus]|uniref:Thiamine pyrophosphate-binding protein n=2 Tax=Neobacillus TaxID=2675232 RepID=A0A942UBI3_9BACI|nr:MULTISPECIES: thiamine pyrophosphate-binding protein [Neobacillus]MBS4215134.1 thiamine pyrophosphate-binding protein [Neobacillus rhizophilus]MCH6264529.1 thiamine pyrophosphate-binding protein [Neobacillus citreus]